MLTITVPGTESWDEVNEKFIISTDQVLELEHSLLSLSKWEARYEKPFLSNEKKTTAETYYYFNCMSLGVEVTDELCARMTNENLEEINSYIEAKQSATWFTDVPGGPKSREIITAEIIYHWMFALNVPLEFESRHLGKLFTQIKVISEKNKPAKKMGRAEALAQQRRLNAERLAASGSAG